MIVYRHSLHWVVRLPSLIHVCVFSSLAVSRIQNISRYLLEKWMNKGEWAKSLLPFPICWTYPLWARFAGPRTVPHPASILSVPFFSNPRLRTGSGCLFLMAAVSLGSHVPILPHPWEDRTVYYSRPRPRLSPHRPSSTSPHRRCS